MRWITAEEADAWRLASVDRPANEMRVWSGDFDPKLIGSFALMREINRALPRNKGRLLRILDWETYPTEEHVFIRRLRAADGEFRSLVEAPAVTFEAHEYSVDSYDDRAPEVMAEEAALVGYLNFVFAAGWSAEFRIEGAADYFLVQEQKISILTTGDQTRKVIQDCIKRFS